MDLPYQNVFDKRYGTHRPLWQAAIISQLVQANAERSISFNTTIGWDRTNVEEHD